MLLSSSGTGKHDKLSPDLKWDKHKLNNSSECRRRAYHHNTFISKYDGFFVAFPKFLLPTPLPICSHLTDFLRDTVISKVYFRCSYTQVESWNKCNKYPDINLAFGFCPQLTSNYKFNSFSHSHVKTILALAYLLLKSTPGPLKFNFRSWEKSATCQHQPGASHPLGAVSEVLWVSPTGQ